MTLFEMSDFPFHEFLDPKTEYLLVDRNYYTSAGQASSARVFNRAVRTVFDGKISNTAPEIQASLERSIEKAQTDALDAVCESFRALIVDNCVHRRAIYATRTTNREALAFLNLFNRDEVCFDGQVFLYWFSGQTLNGKAFEKSYIVFERKFLDAFQRAHLFDRTDGLLPIETFLARRERKGATTEFPEPMITERIQSFDNLILDHVELSKVIPAFSLSLPYVSVSGEEYGSVVQEQAEDLSAFVDRCADLMTQYAGDTDHRSVVRSIEQRIKQEYDTYKRKQEKLASGVAQANGLRLTLAALPLTVYLLTLFADDVHWTTVDALKAAALGTGSVALSKWINVIERRHQVVGAASPEYRFLMSLHQ